MICKPIVSENIFFGSRSENNVSIRLIYNVSKNILSGELCVLANVLLV